MSSWSGLTYSELREKLRNTNGSVEGKPENPDVQLEEGRSKRKPSEHVRQIQVLSKKVKKTNDPNEKLDLIASQNVHLAALVLGMTERLTGTKR